MRMALLIHMGESNTPFSKSWHRNNEETNGAPDW